MRVFAAKWLHINMVSNTTEKNSIIYPPSNRWIKQFNILRVNIEVHDLWRVIKKTIDVSGFTF